MTHPQQQLIEKLADLIDECKADRATDAWQAEAVAALAALSAGAVPQQEPQEWQPIETAPHDSEVFFWVVPKTADESYTDTSGKPIVRSFQPYLHRGKLKTWSALSKATHWRPLPPPPAVPALPTPQEQDNDPQQEHP